MPSELSPAQLSELADAIAKRLADRMAAQSALLDYVGLAEWLNVSVPTIEKLKRAGSIPYISTGRRVLFDRVSVVKALTKSPGVRETYDSEEKK